VCVCVYFWTKRWFTEVVRQQIPDWWTGDQKKRPTAERAQSVPLVWLRTKKRRCWWLATSDTGMQQSIRYWGQWCGLRLSVLGQDWSRTKKIGLGLGFACCGLGLAGLVLCCETRSCFAHRHNDLEGQQLFKNYFYFSLFCAWNIATVEINRGIYLLKS